MQRLPRLTLHLPLSNPKFPNPIHPPNQHQLIQLQKVILVRLQHLRPIQHQLLILLLRPIQPLLPTCLAVIQHLLLNRHLRPMPLLPLIRLELLLPNQRRIPLQRRTRLEFLLQNLLLRLSPPQLPSLLLERTQVLTTYLAVNRLRNPLLPLNQHLLNPLLQLIRSVHQRQPLSLLPHQLAMVVWTIYSVEVKPLPHLPPPKLQLALTRVWPLRTEQRTSLAVP